MQDTIIINGRFLTQPVTGVQRYSIELMRHMDLLVGAERGPRSVSMICLAPRVPFDAPSWRNIQLRRVGVNRGNLWEQIDLPWHAAGRMIFSPANIGPWHYSNQVVTFHDAAVFAMPSAYSLAFRVKYKFVFRQLARRARRILTDSEFSRGELARYLGLAAERIVVIPLGADHLDSLQPEMDVLGRHGLKKESYLLTVASQSPHKNLYNVFDAVGSLGTDIKAVMVGGSFKKVFREKGMRKLPQGAQNLGYVNDCELKALYENALGLVFPSTYEGFGLPALEAMRSGCPVLCANAASLPEVAGAAALYFDPGDVDDIGRTIGRFLSDARLRRALREMGRLRADKYRWSETARTTLEALCEVPPPGGKSPQGRSYAIAK